MIAPHHILMLGTGPTTRGGIASVVGAYRSAGLFERWPIRYVETHCDGGWRQKLAMAWRALATVIGAFVHGPVGVLHVHSASRWSFWRKSVFMAAALAFDWPIVFHLHGGGFARFHREECGPLRRRLVKYFLDRAAVIIVVSERWAAWMAKVTANPRIVCIPNPVALRTPSTAAREPGLVAFSGRCEAGKGVFDLLDAAALLTRRCPELHLECAGDGDLDAVRRHAARLGLDARLATPGWIDARARDALLARAAVFALPSHAEGLPMSLLEAMAAGCAVVASAVGGIPDLVVHGVNGLLVPPGDAAALADAIRVLLQDEPLATRLGHEARATVAARYTTERSIERLGQIYAGLGVRREPAPAAVPSPRLQEIA